MANLTKAQRDQEVCIGTTEKVGKILGLEYEVMENIQKDNSILRTQLHESDRAMKTILGQHKRYVKQLCDIGSASVWKRLRWVLTGIPYGQPN